jgi:alpha/beta superfamily hydrolase
MHLSRKSLILMSLFMACTALFSTGFAQTATEAPPPYRGQLLEYPPPQLVVLSPSDLIAKITDGTISRWLLRKTFSPRCSVAIYQIRYGTVGARGEPTTASGALMFPYGADGVCQSPRPIVLYAHGKRNLKTFNIADLSGETNYEGVTLALALAADGYIVVAPNYAGYDSSALQYHAFLHADQQSADMMDALTAARTALPAIGMHDNQKLFVTGYSQGGYVAMATHRALEAAGIPVTASAPMSGPYALTAFADAMFMGQVGRGAVEEFVMLASSYQHAYGILYSNPVELFGEKYASAASLLPGFTGTNTLVAQGSIPESALFSSTPPAPEYTSMTPAVTTDRYSWAFASGFGADPLITNSYRQSYLQDVATSPDGGYPNTTTSLPPASVTNPLRQALKHNDLRNWAPIAPVLLCGGDEDPVVYFFNTLLMEGYWAANAPNSVYTVLNIDAPPGHSGPYQNLRERFADVKSLFKLIEGEAAVRKDYHDVLVPAFCLQAVRSFFDNF